MCIYIYACMYACIYKEIFETPSFVASSLRSQEGTKACTRRSRDRGGESVDRDTRRYRLLK